MNQATIDAAATGSTGLFTAGASTAPILDVVLFAIKQIEYVGVTSGTPSRPSHNVRDSVSCEFCGHGIGTVYHDEPQVLHFTRPCTGVVLEPDMIFTIEPMLNAGNSATKQLVDGCTVVTIDRSLSAQWEQMVVVTESGFEVLTTWPDGYGDYSPIAVEAEHSSATA